MSTQSYDPSQTYEVQIFHGLDWTHHKTFQVHERSEAMAEARRLNKERTDRPVRVIFDNLNRVSNHHTRAIVYRNKAKEPVIDVKKQLGQDAKRKRVSVWGYLLIQFSVIMIALLGGFVLSIAGDGIIRALGYRLSPEIRDQVYFAIFALSFMSVGFLAYQHFMSKFVYRPKNKALRNPVYNYKGFYEKQKNKLQNSRMARQMQKAASEIDQLPARDYAQENYPQEAFDEKIEEVYALNKNAREHQHKVSLFISTFLSDCLNVLKSAELSLNNQNLFGLKLLVMGALDQLMNSFEIEDEENTRLSRETLAMMGMEEEKEQMQFLFDFERFDEDPIHHQLIEQGRRLAVSLQEEDQIALNELPRYLENWNKAQGYNRFMLVCRLLNGEEADKKVFDQFLFEFGASASDEDASIYLVDFRNAKMALEESLWLAHGVGKKAQLSLNLLVENEMGLFELKNLPMGFNLSQSLYDIFSGDPAYCFGEANDENAVSFYSIGYPDEDQAQKGKKASSKKSPGFEKIDFPKR